MNIYVTQNSMLVEVITPKQSFGVSELHRTPKTRFRLHRSRSCNRSRKNIIFGIGVGIGIEKKIFSEWESGFGIKKCNSADHYLECIE